MNFVFLKLNNIEIEKGVQDVDFKEFMPKVNGMCKLTSYIFEQELPHPSGIKAYKGGNIGKLIDGLHFKETFGKISYETLMKSQLFLFLLPSEKFEVEIVSKEIYDLLYTTIDRNLSDWVLMFSMACWFIKDCCVTSTELFHINGFNGYGSRVTRDMLFTTSKGNFETVYFDSNEIEMALKISKDIYKFFLQEEETPVNTFQNNGNIFIDIESGLNPENKSFCRALIFLQQARKTGYLVSKIEKYCSVLECLFAINWGHKKNVKNIMAAYIGENQDDETTIRNDMAVAYGIRSDFSHGDYISYLKHNSKEDLENLSQRIDSYVRRVLVKAFLSPELNYTKDTQKKVREYFLNIAQKKYPNDYK